MNIFQTIGNYFKSFSGNGYPDDPFYKGPDGQTWDDYRKPIPAVPKQRCDDKPIGGDNANLDHCAPVVVPPPKYIENLLSGQNGVPTLGALTKPLV